MDLWKAKNCQVVAHAGGRTAAHGTEVGQPLLSTLTLTFYYRSACKPPTDQNKDPDL